MQVHIGVLLMMPPSFAHCRDCEIIDQLQHMNFDKIAPIIRSQHPALPRTALQRLLLHTVLLCTSVIIIVEAHPQHCLALPQDGIGDCLLLGSAIGDCGDGLRDCRFMKLLGNTFVSGLGGHPHCFVSPPLGPFDLNVVLVDAPDVCTGLPLCLWGPPHRRIRSSKGAHLCTPGSTTQHTPSAFMTPRTHPPTTTTRYWGAAGLRHSPECGFLLKKTKRNQHQNAWNAAHHQCNVW